MFCIACGTELPDEANFCFKCGKPTACVEVKTKDSTETCEIIYEITGEKNGIYPRTLLRFKAQAQKVDGEYCAGVSNEFEASIFDYPGRPEKKNKKHKKALELLTEKLKQSGWREKEGKGKDWFSLQFQRE